jgi:hypothetical protein
VIRLEKFRPGFFLRFFYDGHVESFSRVRSVSMDGYITFMDHDAVVHKSLVLDARAFGTVLSDHVPNASEMLQVALRLKNVGFLVASLKHKVHWLRIAKTFSARWKSKYPHLARRPVFSVMRDCARWQPTHVSYGLTGDITHLSLPEQFKRHLARRMKYCDFILLPYIAPHQMRNSRRVVPEWGLSAGRRSSNTLELKTFLTPDLGIGLFFSDLGQFALGFEQFIGGINTAIQGCSLGVRSLVRVGVMEAFGLQQRFTHVTPGACFGDFIVIASCLGGLMDYGLGMSMVDQIMHPMHIRRYREVVIYNRRLIRRLKSVLS